MSKSKCQHFLLFINWLNLTSLPSRCKPFKMCHSYLFCFSVLIAIVEWSGSPPSPTCGLAIIIQQSCGVRAVTFELSKFNEPFHITSSTSKEGLWEELIQNFRR